MSTVEGTVDSFRRRLIGTLARGCAVVPFLSFFPLLPAASEAGKPKEGEMKLPKADRVGRVSVEEALTERRTVRSFSSKLLDVRQLSQVLWAGQGITGAWGKRTAPSAGALYPSFLYAATGRATAAGIEPGLYRYVPEDHSLSIVSQRDIRGELARSCLSQTWMARAPVSLVICSDYGRITGKYGERGIRYAMIEAGHIAQNIFIEAAAIGLSAGIVGAFIDGEAIKAMGIPQSHTPLLIMPVGYKG
ncbi:MAG TPA: SagB/ThcOx family dehydrogenase [Deltaproteobacteria bacterium]|nr:SagB/ThcOx family dehydrogenase [Deltaproteobacteria bacterium]